MMDIELGHAPVTIHKNMYHAEKDTPDMRDFFFDQHYNKPKK
jgi:hypothetical protein